MEPLPLRLVAVGVGDAFSEISYGTCLALVTGSSGPEDPWLMVDCPHPVRKMLHEARARSGEALRLDRLLGVVLTHLHADHASGIESLAWWFHFVERRKLPLWTHPDVAARLWEGHLAAGMEHLLVHRDAEPITLGLADVIDLGSLQTDTPVQIGPFSIESRRTIHHIPTFAQRISVPGGSVGLSSDTCYDPALLAWLDSCDRVVHESNFGIHTPLADLEALPAELRARMWLHHLPDGVVPRGIEVLQEGGVYPILPRSGAFNPARA